MVSISKPLSAPKVSAYFRSEYGPQTKYFVEANELRGDWHGKIAEEFGLEGQQITAEHFDRLALGQHPITGEQLIRHRDTVKAKDGKELGHRAGFDVCFSAPKSVSLTALVGGDERVMEAHRQAVEAALAEVELMNQARGGGLNPPITTGRMVAASFQHATARPVDRYSAAQLHTHVVLFNLTMDDSGQWRSLQPREHYVAATMYTAVYQNRLETELRKLGYVIGRGRNNAPEIAGFSPEYLASESRRSKEIETKMEEKGWVGAGAASLVAHSTRDSKLDLSPDELRAAHLENAIRFGDQPQQVVATAAERIGQVIEPESGQNEAAKAVEHARRKLMEREAVFDHHEVITEALRFARGQTTLPAVKAELSRQKEAGKFIAVGHVRPHAPLWRYTTPEAIADKCAVIKYVVGAGSLPLISSISREDLAIRFADRKLNEQQLQIIFESVSAEKAITGIQGSAGSGKTTATEIIRELAEENGWHVVGLGPTSRAANELRAAGVPDSQTIQRFLVVPQNSAPLRRLFLVDESSLVATHDMRQVLEWRRPADRMIIIGDRRQHGPVEAGRIFETLQVAGMQTARINKLVRQKDPRLKVVIEAFARGMVVEGVQALQEQGRVVSIDNRRELFKRLAQDFAADPKGTMAINPDNAGREVLSNAIRTELRAREHIGEDVFHVKINIARQSLTREDLLLASSYEPGDVLLYRRGSRQYEFAARTYATVIAVDSEANQITVQTTGGKMVTYNPERLHGVSVYEQSSRSFAVGDRMQFTAPNRKLGVSNRQTGHITALDAAGNVRVKMDEGGRSVGFNFKDNRHVEYGYVFTSQSAQGATVDRILLHVPTGDSRVRNLVTQTLGYVGLSRPRYDAKIYTDDETQLAKALSRQVAKTTALSQEQIQEYRKGVAA